MAPVKGSKAAAASKNKSKASSKLSKPSSKPKSSGPIKATQQKTKPNSHRQDKKKKKRVYTEKELGIPALNGILPAGVAKPKGTKKGKTFVDDGEGMMAILAMVQAEKEGDIESKIMKARQMEEVREAKRAEAEKREGEKRKKLEMVKDEVRKAKGDKRKRKVTGKQEELDEEKPKSKKRVSFG